MQITIDVTALKVNHMRQLERAKSFADFADWFVAHAGADPVELDELSLPEMMAVASEVQTQIAAGMKLPKASGSSS